MSQNTEIMEMVLKKCDIMLDGKIISKEMLIQSFASFLSQTVGKRKHNVGVVMHTESVCFDVLAVTYAAIINLISNETRADDIIESMHLGDIVLYGEKKKARYVFDGKIDGSYLSKEDSGKTYIKLLKGNGKVFVPDRRWHFIEPYNGSSIRLDGRGIRKKNTGRDDFFVEVLGYKKENVPSVTDTSSVIVLPRDKADMLMKGISLQFGKNNIKLLELATASYYSEQDEYCYGGNSGKNEPVLKFAGKISVARKLLYSRQGNLHIGLMILGNESINRGITELPELINRKSLQYVYLCSSMNFDFGIEVLKKNEEVEVFACTKDFLLENSTNESKVKNEYTNELLQQVKTVIEKENKLIIIQDSPIELEEYDQFMKNLLWIKRSDFDSVKKDDFIIHAHSLMNLFITAVFSMKTLVKIKEQGKIDIGTPLEKLSQLKNWAYLLPGNLKEKADVIIRILNMMYSKLLSGNGKESWLYEYLARTEYKKIAIIVPKAYYATIIRADLNCSYSFIRNVCVTTPSRFDDTVTYDLIIAVGNVEGNRFNVFRCNSASNIISLLYNVETKKYTSKKRSAEEDIHYLQNRSTIKVEMAEELEEIEETNEIVLEADNEIDDYIASLDSFVDPRHLVVGNTGGNYNVNAEIVAIAVFTDESIAYFSKNYKGYVFDENTGNVKEEGPLSFCEGDSIVFTKNNNETKDIVDSILNNLIQDGKVSESVAAVYNKSKFWKDALIGYMREENISMKEVANRMIKNGIPVQEPAICRWLDEDSHTVGPQSVNSIAQIGMLVGNEELSKNAESYFEACREIRSIRRQILEQVGQAIIGKLSGKNPDAGMEYAAIYDRVDSLTEILQIKRLIFVERMIPMNMANRPVQI